MKSITHPIQRVLMFAVMLLSVQAQAAAIMTGSSSFSESSGVFSGTLFAEVSGVAGNYTSTFNMVMDADADGSISAIRDITFSSWMLGSAFGNTGAVSGGSAGGDPGLAIIAGPYGNDARFDFSSPGLAEGATSVSFWFNHAELNLGGDAMFFGISDFSNNVASGVSLNLQPVPLPATVWLLGSGLVGLAGLTRRKRNRNP